MGNEQRSTNSVGALFLSVLIWSVHPSLQAEDAVETKSAFESDAQGWTDILPSADLKEWFRVPVPPNARLGREQWHLDAERKVLVCDGDGGHDMLLFNKEIGDAIFHLEFCFIKGEGKRDYNSGIYIRNSKDGAIWHQTQIGDGKDGYLFGQTAVNGYGKKNFNLSRQVTKSRIKPAGEWNTLEITARGPVLTLWVNGATQCEFNGCGLEKGFIGLEGEGYRIEFRNLQLKEL